MRKLSELLTEGAPAAVCRDADALLVERGGGELFDLNYDLLLYDVTSTYCEGKEETTSRPGAATAGTTVRHARWRVGA